MSRNPAATMYQPKKIRPPGLRGGGAATDDGASPPSFVVATAPCSRVIFSSRRSRLAVLLVLPRHGGCLSVAGAYPSRAVRSRCASRRVSRAPSSSGGTFAPPKL